MSTNAIQIATAVSLGITLFVKSWRTSSSTVTKSHAKSFAWLQQRFVRFFYSAPDVEDMPRMGNISTAALVHSKQENRITSRGCNPGSPLQQLRALRIRAENIESRMKNQDRRINSLEKYAIDAQADLACGRRNIAMNRVAINAQGDMLKRGEEERKEMKKELEKVKGVTEEHKMCFYIYGLSFVGILCYLSANGY